VAVEAARLANRFPRTLGSAENVPARYRCEGLAVRIAVGAPADHAGSRVIRVWGPATEHDVSASDEPGQPAGLYVRRCAPITEGVVMSRTRVHNMNISLDGYAAGEHVTFDAPIGGA